MKTSELRKRRRRYTNLADAPEASLAQQQFKEDCDMNNIVRKAMRGIPPRFQREDEPQYGDFSNPIELERAFNTMAQAKDAFMNLPAELRLELNNDPRRIAYITAEQAKRYKLTETPQVDSEGLPPSPAAPVARTPKAGKGDPAAASGKAPKVDSPSEE